LASFTEGPVKRNHSPDGTRRPTTKYVGPKLIVSYLYSPDNAIISLWQRHIGWMSQIFPTPLYLAQICGKALQFLKLKSSRQPTVKIWRS